MAESYYAHMSEDGRVHSVRAHLTPHLSSPCQGEAERGKAADFAGEFGCAEWERLKGEH